MYTATSNIKPVEVTLGSAGDSPVLLERFQQIPEGEAIDTSPAAIIDPQSSAINAIRKNNRPCRYDCKDTNARKEALRATRTVAGRSTSAERDTLQRARSRRKCSASRLLANPSPQETQTAKLPEP